MAARPPTTSHRALRREPDFTRSRAGATAPIFDGFTLYNKQKAAEAALEQAEAQYRATVITAFQNVADALRALQADARAMQAAVRAEDTAKASLDIVQQQLNAGQVNQLAVLNAQQTYLTAAVIRVQTEANRLSDTAALVHGARRRLADRLHDAGLARNARWASRRTSSGPRMQNRATRSFPRDGLEERVGSPA